MITRIKRIFEQYPLFLFTIPLFLVIHLEQQYHTLIRYDFVYKDILVIFSAPIIAIGLSWLLLRKRAKASIFAFALLVIHYFFSDLKDILQQKMPRHFLSSYTFLLPLTIILLLLLFIYLKKKQSPFSKPMYFINLVFLLFIVSDIVLMFTDYSARKKDSGDQEKTISRNYIPCDTCTKPDIYYLLFDAYTSSAELRSEFQYNNSLDSILLKRGFFVANKSRSNYSLTPFSMSSCFNMNFLPGVKVPGDIYLNDYLPCLISLYKSELAPIMEKQGYQFVNYSIFDIENHPPRITPFNIWNIDDLYERHNIINKVNMDIGWLIREKLHIQLKQTINREYQQLRNDRLLETLDSLNKTIRTINTQPQFVYAHFVLPHQPYTFDSLGNQHLQKTFLLSKKETKAGYVQQVAFSNRIIQGLVDSIFTHASRPVVIIIQGDHGCRIGDAPLQQREFANLSAFYFYNKDYRLLYDSISNVNTFRVISNTFFGQHYPLLKDTSLFLESH